MSPDIKVVPLTDSDLEHIQLTIAQQILDINRKASDGKIPSDLASEEIEKLTKVAEKCSKYQKDQGRPVKKTLRRKAS